MALWCQHACSSVVEKVRVTMTDWLHRVFALVKSSSHGEMCHPKTMDTRGKHKHTC